MIKRQCWTAVLVAVPFLLVAGALQAETIVTGPVTQAGFQALLDAADSGDTISCLGGVYDFSAPGPVIIDKGLAIQAADAHDPPVFVGDGTTSTDLLTGNNGFVQSPGSRIDGLTIQGLHFQSFDRTLAFPLSFDHRLPGCPQIPGAGASNVHILDNTDRGSRLFFQVFGGPFEDFLVEGNDIEVSQWGIYVDGDFDFCADGSLVDLVRPVGGVIEGNHVKGAFSSIVVQSAEDMAVEQNRTEDAFFGIIVADPKAYLLPDDGPISLGSVEANTVDALFAGIVAEGTTTIADAKIEDNQINGAIIGILLDFGANGFKVEGNTFSEIGVAEVYLGLDEENLIPGGCGFVECDEYAWAPETINNKVEAGEHDRVFDFGVDNEVEIDDDEDSDSDDEEDD